MKNFVRRIAVVIGAVAVSAGLVGASVAPASADQPVTSFRDSGWPA